MLKLDPSKEGKKRNQNKESTMSRILLPIMCRAQLRIHFAHRFLSSLRLLRLCSTVTVPHHPASKSKSSSLSPPSITRIRNVGIIAHIDAGKTTTTERFLFYSGLTGEMGEVHDGDTVTDYMEQERERGITITSAAVTFPWMRHRINLIDTPGHVDFTVEVERSLCALDSALVVLDASEGVEAQTVTVWHQADRHHVPRIVYLNKMDKPAADVDYCLKTIQLLGSKPLLLHLPVRGSDGKQFTGIIDLVKMEQLTWDIKSDMHGEVFSREAVSKGDQMFEEAMMKRESLIASIADIDEGMAEEILNKDDTLDIRSDLIRQALRRVTISRHFIPVLMGSSFKKIAVQPLMDSIIDLLPSPVDVIKRNTNFFAGFLCALAFKVIHHKNYGALTFVRIYAGEIRTSSRVFNVNRNRQEQVSKIYIALADEFKEVTSMSSGNIVAVTGLECITGDTIVSSHAALQEVSSYEDNLLTI